MQPYRFHHLGLETRLEPGGATILMHIIDALFGSVVGQVVKQVADVMKQAGGHEGGAKVALPGQKRALQGVFALRDRLAAVLRPAQPVEQVDNLFRGIGHWIPPEVHHSFTAGVLPDP
jgi:hypothetical protein